MPHLISGLGGFDDLLHVRVSSRMERSLTVAFKWVLSQPI